MGVLGLTPFLKKLCPQVLKELPNRLREFQGKTIAIDGTLITHRLHFAAIPHESRHVLGWYRLLDEFRQSGVRAICVFDGERRVSAKTREAMRRSRIRSLTIARGSVETERHLRLKSLLPLLQEIEQLEHTVRTDIISGLQDEVLASPEPPPPLIDSTTSAQPWPSVVTSPTEPHTDEPKTAQLFSRLHSLFTQHRQGSQRISSLQSTTPVSAEDPVDSGTDFMLSKTQIELESSENRIWETICNTELDTRTTHKDISELAVRSFTMSETLNRRSAGPDSKTYAESKEIIQAMGIPCITVEDQYEAEAVASSLVLNGKADYVASEDTDVLVYSAPLIRNISNRQGPLLLILGKEIRSGLNLTNESFVDFALLLGTDFSDRIKNVGPARAFKFIQEHGTIERIIDKETKYPPRISANAYMKQVAVARTIFHNLPPPPPNELLLQNVRDDDLVSRIMARHNLERELKKGQETTPLMPDGNLFDDDPRWYGVSETDDYHPQWYDFELEDIRVQDPT